jgi:hypothetical protein
MVPRSIKKGGVRRRKGERYLLPGSVGRVYRGMILYERCPDEIKATDTQIITRCNGVPSGTDSQVSPDYYGGGGMINTADMNHSVIRLLRDYAIGCVFGVIVTPIFIMVLR